MSYDNDDMTLELGRLVTAEELADYLSCHVVTIRRMARDGRLKAIRIGRRLRFDVGVVEDALMGAGATR